MRPHQDDELSTADDAEGGGDKAFDNLQTWPKSQLSQRGLSELHEWIQLESVLNRAKSFVRLGQPDSRQQNEAGNNKASNKRDNASRRSSAAGGGANDVARMQAATELIEALTKQLEKHAKGAGGSSNRVGMFRKRRESVGTSAASEMRRPRFTSVAATSGSNMNVIREDPHFESMIICDTLSKPNGLAASKSYGSMDTVRSSGALQNELGDDDYDDGNNKDPGVMSPISETHPPMIPVAEIPGESATDPALLRAIPHLLLLMCTILYLVGGAYIFCLIDDHIAAKPFRVVLLFAFQTCTSIGWGDTSPTNRWSQLFCVVYTIFGVPIIFSTFANIGRLMTEFYCIDWLFLTAVVRERVKMYTEKILPDLPQVQDNFQAIEVRRRFPIRATINLLFIHQCIGVLLYGSLIKQFTVIQVIYFSITSMATTGYGDIHPDPQSMAESIIVIVYISSGIIIFSALLLSIGYHFQRIIYVLVPNYLHYYYEKHRRRNAVADSSGKDMNGNANGDPKHFCDAA